MAGEFRNVGSSLHWRIVQILRQWDWSIARNGLPATPATGPLPDGTPLPDHAYAVAAAGFFPIDEEMAVDPANVTVKVDGVAVDRAEVHVDHGHAMLWFDQDPGGAVTVDALVNPVTVVEGYPEEEYLETAELPVIAWSVDVAQGTDFRVGGALQNRTFFCTIDILANSRNEAKDLLEILYRSLTHVRYYDFTAAEPTGPDGDLSPTWDNVDQAGHVFRQRRRPRASLPSPRPGGHEKERHRGLITLQLDRVS